jgi:hypothetical protein
VLPTVCALDIIVPADGVCPGEPVVIDFNGSRSGLIAAERRTKNRELEKHVLSFLAEAGSGTILAPVQNRSPAILEKFSIDTLLRLAQSPVGLNRVNDAYVPIGPEFNLADEERTARLARRMGIHYSRITADWDEEQRDFSLFSNEESIGLLRHWHPKEGIVWPYSWNRRAVPLPEGAKIIEPLPYYLLATNKLFLAAADDVLRKNGRMGLPIPRSWSFGFLRPAGPSLNRLLHGFGSTPLAVIKPAAGRRGFGVLAAPVGALSQVAEMVGVTAAERLLQLGAKLIAAASLWGDLPNACTIIQPFIDGKLRRHPLTGRLHTTVYRATVKVEAHRSTCLDVTCILASTPREESSSRSVRSSLILSASDDVLCIDPGPEGDAVAHTATRFIGELYEFIVDHFHLGRLRSTEAMLNEECQVSLKFGDRMHDFDVLPTVEMGWKCALPLIKRLANASDLAVQATAI